MRIILLFLLSSLLMLRVSFVDGQIDWSDYNYLKSVLPAGYISETSQILDMNDLENESDYVLVWVYQVTGTGYRGTTRLVIIHKVKGYFGVYSGISDKPISISRKGIEFPYEERFGNLIAFDEDGPVSETLLDGEMFSLEKMSHNSP